MRPFPLIILLLAVSCSLSGADAKSPSTNNYVNAKVSSRTIALNQPVRVEFTTMPRQVTGVDIQSAVAHSLELAPAQESWRLMAPPQVSEVGKTDKIQTVTVAFSLLPRQPGDLALPQIQLTWLSGDQIAEFGTVTISNDIQVGSETKPAPKEAAGVSGFVWGCKLDDVKGRIGETSQISPGCVMAKPEQNLELNFLDGELAEAFIRAPGLTLEQARDSFVNRWGVPQTDKDQEITWILGWTRITAGTYGDKATSGTVVHLVREDIQGKRNKVKVKDQVFQLLDGKEQVGEEKKVDERAERDKAIDDEAKRVTNDYLKNKPKD